MSRLTVEQAVQKYLRHLTLEKGASENTVSNYARDLHRYSAFLADQGITDPEAVTAATIEAFVLFLSTPDPVSGRAALAASSRARATVAVRSLHKFLLLDGAVETNPAADVRPPATGSRLPKALSIAETAALIEAAGEVDSADPIVVRNRALLEVLYATGARVSELCAMDLDDVDPEDSWIRVTGKGNKQRAVPMGTTAHAALQAYIVRARPVLNKRGTAALFINQRGTRMGRQSVWTVLKDAAERAEITAEVSPHTLRHCFATHLLEGGADVRVVQELLGHASVTTTQIYTKVTASLLREVWQQAHPRARR